MAENESFLRKVVRFVANPATDWTDLSAKPEDSREQELEKTELRAMIERKRRNDFVRKREFDMLRRVRREGLSPENLAALGTSSRVDDSEVRLSEHNAPRQDGVKAKIDEIEQQMVGDAGFSATLRDRGSGSATGPALPPLEMDLHKPRAPAPAAASLPAKKLPAAAPTAAAHLSMGLSPLAPPSAVPKDAPVKSRRLTQPGEFESSSGLVVSEVAHDPELDEAVIAFANADFAQSEEALRRLTQRGGPRAAHAETWLVLFDLYRATGQQQPFENLAVDYAHRFGWSAPQWYSLPKLVAEAQAAEPATESARGSREAGEVGWICPEHLDVEAVARLGSQSLQMPLPWVFEWQDLQRIDTQAAVQLAGLFRSWAAQPLQLRWMTGERLFSVLAEAAPNGVRDADPAYWLTRLEALRLANRVDEFDEAAIEYCLTYEVSPPSWEPPRCTLQVSGSGASTRPPPSSMVSDTPTGFMESVQGPELGMASDVAHVELFGQLVGDIGVTLAKLQSQLSKASVISVSCARLIRVDFIAAGDLLNWVLNQQSQHRSVHFVDTHRMVALFFGAMGINEHAKVQVRKV